MLIFLAQLEGPTRTDAFNASFVGWLIVSILVAVQIAVGVKNLRRAPSMEVEITKLKASIQALCDTVDTLENTLEELEDRVNEAPKHDGQFASIAERLESGARHMARIDERLKDGDEKLAALREKQAINSTALEGMKDDMHHVKLTVTAVAAKLKVRSE